MKIIPFYEYNIHHELSSLTNIWRIKKKKQKNFVNIPIDKQIYINFNPIKNYIKELQVKKK